MRDCTTVTISRNMSVTISVGIRIGVRFVRGNGNSWRDDTTINRVLRFDSISSGALTITFQLKSTLEISRKFSTKA